MHRAFFHYEDLALSFVVVNSGIIAGEFVGEAVGGGIGGGILVAGARYNAWSTATGGRAFGPIFVHGHSERIT